jgi:hypothetical protein
MKKVDKSSVNVQLVLLSVSCATMPQNNPNFKGIGFFKDDF